MTEPILSLADANTLLQLEQHHLEHRFQLNLPTLSIHIRANNVHLIEQLTHYFSPILKHYPATDQPVIEVSIIETVPLNTERLPFLQWQREAGKQGRKDAYLDFPGGRLIHKVRTGMLFLQSASQRVALGPCLQNLNQVINFINNQHLNQLQQHGAQLGHAAALQYREQGIAIAGFSGGGKSTLMLQLMELAAARFLTNDRLLLQRKGKTTLGSGIAKWPRINPGTIVHNPHLHPLLSAARREQLLTLPKADLWALEEKYDADIETLYGPGRIELQVPIHHLLLLNWKADSRQPTQLHPINLGQHLELLAALLKTPGPFYQDSKGHFSTDRNQPNRDHYLRALEPVQTYEVSGRINFDAIKQQLLEYIA